MFGMAKKKLNGNEPATQHDLSLLAGQVTRRIDQVEDKLTEEIASLRQVVNAVFKVVKSIDGQLRELRDIPERVTRLERDVFQLKLEVRRGKQ